MRKQIKTLVKQNYETMKPFIIRGKGQVPPILFFQFDSIDPKLVEELAITQQDEMIHVENGFFVPMSQPEVVINRKVFLDFMSTIMASLKTTGVAGDLKAVTVAVSGKSIQKKQDSEEVESEIDAFVVYGVDDKGKDSFIAKELKMQMGEKDLTCSLVNSKFLDDTAKSAKEMFLEDFFDKYIFNLERIAQDKSNLETITEGYKGYESDPAKFAAELIDVATHATVLANSTN